MLAVQAFGLFWGLFSLGGEGWRTASVAVITNLKSAFESKWKSHPTISAIWRTRQIHKLTNPWQGLVSSWVTQYDGNSYHLHDFEA